MGYEPCIGPMALFLRMVSVSVMRLIRQLPDASLRPSAVAIGNFDGVHLGHRAVIARMKELADAHGLVPTVLTFEPHPRRFFQRQGAAFHLQRLRDKFLDLEALGVAQLVVLRFDAAFASLSAEAFLHEVLGRGLMAKAVVTGENFVFGQGRKGDSTMLKHWGAAQGIAIAPVAPVMVVGQVCSSTAVRAALSRAEMAQVAALLGRPYRLSGRVVHGDARGRQLGFPTANVRLPEDLLLPPYGVYAVQVALEGRDEVIHGVANLGVRPTMGGDARPLLEVHLFEFGQEIYGKRLRVAFVHNLRPEMKFDSVDKLKAQIAADCVAARAVL